MSVEAKVYKVKVGDREIEIDEKVLEVLHEYVHREMELNELAKRLGLKDWREAYQFLKNVESWIMWIQPTLWQTMARMRRAEEEVARK